ncbi:hypothetical protein [Nocardia brasiliensis]|uniref:hypothetical protein n=1 Tax=Nocardia brasiliensis TaxID=37326 RepID=UPI003CC7D163
MLDEPGYPLRRGFRFTAPESDREAPRYLYWCRPRPRGAPGRVGSARSRQASPTVVGMPVRRRRPPGRPTRRRRPRPARGRARRPR